MTKYKPEGWKRISPEEIENVIDFRGYGKIVAWEKDGTIIGYARYYCPDEPATRSGYVYEIIEISDDYEGIQRDHYTEKDARHDAYYFMRKEDKEEEEEEKVL